MATPHRPPPPARGSKTSHSGRNPIKTLHPVEQSQIWRSRTQTDLLAAAGGVSPPMRLPARVLVHVTVQRSLGPVQVIASTEWTVEELVKATVRIYVKEGRRPQLPTMEASRLGLHYSQFSLECLNPREKLIELGSRNFFLCPKLVCLKEVERGSKMPDQWLRFMVFVM